ncbi:MAG TPA: FAD-dependent oxidoreductase [Candidatus Babeliaceae bacterium]|nr:FAD-dependent oxidoreductase [Candidatus Babeliaceae bacterium]
MKQALKLFFIIISIGLLNLTLDVYAKNQKLDFDRDILNQYEHTIPILVIGSGPGGYSAAIYGGRAHMPVALITGNKVGGQLGDSAYVENIPGIDGRAGHEVVELYRAQAERFGTHFIYDVVTEVNFDSWPFVIKTEEGRTLHALTVIIATGASPRLLGIPGEQEHFGNGISVCATCDGILFTGKNIVIVGGGDAAMEQAEMLAPLVKEITILVRSCELRAAPHVHKRLKEYGNVSILYNKKVLEVIGNDDGVTGVLVMDTVTDREYFMPTDGIFLAIGHNPNTELFKPYLKLDKAGYIELEARDQKTNIPGVFAAGDVCDYYRQAVVAQAQGAMAAIDALRFLREDVGITDKTVRSLSTLYKGLKLHE